MSNTLFTFLKSKANAKQGSNAAINNDNERVKTESSTPQKHEKMKKIYDDEIDQLSEKKIEEILRKGKITPLVQLDFTKKFQHFIDKLSNNASELQSKFTLIDSFQNIIQVKQEILVALCEENYYDSPLLKRLLDDLNDECLNFERDVEDYKSYQDTLVHDLNPIEKLISDEMKIHYAEYERILEHKVKNLQDEYNTKMNEMKVKVYSIESSLPFESQKNIDKFVAVKLNIEKEKLDNQTKKLQRRLDKANEVLIKKEKQFKETKDEFEFLKKDLKDKIHEIETLRQDLDEIKLLHEQDVNLKERCAQYLEETIALKKTHGTSRRRQKSPQQEQMKKESAITTQIIEDLETENRSLWAVIQEIKRSAEGVFNMREFKKLLNKLNLLQKAKLYLNFTND